MCGHCHCIAITAQAGALRLKHKVRERGAAVERGYLRLEAGQPPDEATEQQWQQYLREEQQRKEASITRKVRGGHRHTIHHRYCHYCSWQ